MRFKGDILNKFVGAALVVVSAAFFTATLVVPGVLFGAGGLWLFGRRDKRGDLGPDSQQRLDRLADGLAATQAEITAMQERLERLSEERDFMRQLAMPTGQAPGLSAGPKPLAPEPAGAPAPQADPSKSS